MDGIISKFFCKEIADEKVLGLFFQKKPFFLLWYSLTKLLVRGEIHFVMKVLLMDCIRQEQY